MARKKTITKEQILNAAYDVVATEGFSHFTARNIASKMKCSTQPIYLEFKNMDELKESLFVKIKNHLKSEVFASEVTGDPLIDMALNYIHFATREKVLYRALYVEEHAGGDELTKFGYEIFMEKISQDDKNKDLSEEKKRALFSGTWIVATGIASLKSGGLIRPNDQAIIAMMESVIASIVIGKNNFIVTD